MNDDPGGLQQSLAAMGLAEMALALFCLICYCLVLNAAVPPKVRRVAGPLAVAAATLLAVATEPDHRVILVAIGVAAIGAFVVAAWVVSAACDWAVRRKSARNRRPRRNPRPRHSRRALRRPGKAPMSLGSRLKTQR